MKVVLLSKKIMFPSYPSPYNNIIVPLTQQPHSLYSSGATAATARDRPPCSVPRRFPQLSLATMASLPALSWGSLKQPRWDEGTTQRIQARKINSMVKGMMGPGNVYCSMTEEERFKERIKAKEKTAKFLIYVQDSLGGSNPTVWEVAKNVRTASSPTAFGDVRVVDDLITAKADRNSEKLGRTQGIITYSDMSEPALTMNLTFYFTGGEYKGNSITIGGRNPISHKDREMPIVGGTGIFRMARGYVISNTHSFDAVANYGVLEYTFFVAYPES